MKYFFIAFLLMLVGCNGFRSVKSVFRAMPPYDRYVESLKNAELTGANMTREWLSAGARVFDDSVFVKMPFSESGLFEASNPQARSYRFEAKDGQVLTISGVVRAERDAMVFLDLFIREGDEWEHEAFADSTLSLTYEFSSDEECVVRLQPELLANVWYSIELSLTPVLINPVYGASNKAIGSFYGASRDNGKRKHEGVDIFAPRGTPVIAPTEGYITRVGHYGLGGKFVWMRDLKRQHSYYFAHLDSQMVKPGMQVRQGHVLGLVGNTGNARYTPAHLHFGIYQSGSKDPLYYIRKIEAAVESMPIDTGFHQKPFKVAVRAVKLMTGPSAALPVKTVLPRDTYVTVLAQTSDWYRVALPDDRQGYLPREKLAPLSPSGRVVELDTGTVIRAGVHADALPVAELSEKSRARLLARFATSRYVVTETGTAGWLVN